MAATPSMMIPLGSPAPAFTLPDTLSEKKISLEQSRGRTATVIMFICNHCPYVKLLNAELVKVANTYQPKGINFIAISSNDAGQYPDDGPEPMKMAAKQLGYPFPYLYDETQEVAKAYDAACTPDFFVYDKDLKLAYRGQFDDARPGKDVPVTGKDIRLALDALLAGKQVPQEQRPSIGCNIKWKK
ncbi:MAG: thioredoxin family protein [Bacteroidota bacterium]